MPIPQLQPEHPIEAFELASRNLFRKTFQADGQSPQIQIRSLDVTEEFCFNCTGLQLPALFSVIGTMLACRGKNIWDPGRLVEEFGLAWACCRIAWELEKGTVEAAIKESIPHLPHQNTAQAIIHGLEEYWRLLATFLDRRDGYHGLHLPEPEAAGHEQYLISTKRLAIPRRIDLGIIRTALKEDWLQLSIIVRMRSVADLTALDSRLRSDVLLLSECLDGGQIPSRLRRMWDRIERAMVDTARAGTKIIKSILLWHPDRYQSPVLLSLDMSIDEARDVHEREGHEAILKLAKKWAIPVDSPRILLFAEEQSCFWSLASDGVDPIGRLLVRGDLPAASQEMLGLANRPLELEDGWRLHVRMPAAPLAFDVLPQGLEDASCLLRAMPRPAIGVRGGVRSAAGEFLCVAAMLPLITARSVRQLRLRAKAGGGLVDLGVDDSGVARLPHDTSAGSFTIEGVDDDGALLVSRSLVLVAIGNDDLAHAYADPPASRTLCDVHPEAADDPAGVRLLNSACLPELWPEVPEVACDVTAWFSKAVYLGPRVGEFATEPRPGFGWAVRYDGADEALLTHVGDAVAPDPEPKEKNADTGACRAWRKAFQNIRLSGNVSAEIREGLNAYRAVVRDSVSDRRKTNLGPRPQMQQLLEPDHLVQAERQPRVCEAVAIMAALAVRANARAFCGMSHRGDDDGSDEIPEPGRLLSWLPSFLGFDANGSIPGEVWSIVRLWQEIGIIDITAPAASSGLRWIARRPVWIRARIHDRYQATLMGLIKPGALNRISAEAEELGFAPIELPSESPYAPRVLRCSLPLSKRDTFAAWAVRWGMGVRDLPWTGQEWPSWLPSLPNLVRKHPRGWCPPLAEGVRAYRFDNTARGWVATNAELRGLWRHPAQPGQMPCWEVRVGEETRISPHRDDALLLGVCHQPSLAFRRSGASIISATPASGALPVRLPLACARLCTALAPMLPGPGPEGWRYPLPNRFMAESLAAHLGIP
jgi:hypothetical protein